MNDGKKRQDAVDRFIEGYISNLDRYRALAKIIEDELMRLTKAMEVSILHVTGRVKRADRLRQKIIRKNYTAPAKQVMDLVGVRVVTVYEGDVNRVVSEFTSKYAKVLEFLPEESGNKKASLHTDQFGYLSNHVVIKVIGDTPPWVDFRGMLAEVQVRTTLQNGWADVSHALDYKGNQFAPPKVKRRLHAISALLEIADDDFERMRLELEEMEQEYNAVINSGKLDALGIDALSLALFLESGHFERAVPGGLKSVLEAGRQARMIEWNALSSDSSFDNTALSRLAYTLGELDIRKLKDFAVVLAEVAPSMVALLTPFMDRLLELEGVFHADPVDILTVLVSLQSGKRTIGRGFRRGFDWSGPYLSKPTIEILRALREFSGVPDK